MLNKIKRKLGEIKNGKLYSTKEICATGLISDKVFPIYRLIKAGKIKSVNISSGTLPQYRVKGSDLKNFIKGRYNI